MVNLRKSSDWLGVQAVRKLRSANAFAGVIGQPLNTFVTVAPFRNNLIEEIPSPADTFAAFRNWLGVWIRRHAKIPFTSVGVVHTRPDGTDPHIHFLIRLPAKLISAMRDALAARYPDAGATHIRVDDGRTDRHDCGYYGSTLNYMISHMSPQAWWALGKNVRRRRARAPFVGRRYFITTNIAESAQHKHGDDAILALSTCTHSRVLEERRCIGREESVKLAARVVPSIKPGVVSAIGQKTTQSGRHWDELLKSHTSGAL